MLIQVLRWYILFKADQKRSVYINRHSNPHMCNARLAPRFRNARPHANRIRNQTIMQREIELYQQIASRAAVLVYKCVIWFHKHQCHYPYIYPIIAYCVCSIYLCAIGRWAYIRNVSAQKSWTNSHTMLLTNTASRAFMGTRGDAQQTTPGGVDVNLMAVRKPYFVCQIDSIARAANGQFGKIVGHEYKIHILQRYCANNLPICKYICLAPCATLYADRHPN